MGNKTLAIVILNWNGKSYLEQFLPTVIAHSGEHRIIVADNASTDDSVQFVNSTFPSVEIIVNKSNGGFAKGYNDALAHLSSDYFLLLNSDIEVTENWLEPMLRLMDNDKVAGVQPKVLAFKNKSHFEHAGASGGYLDKNYFPFCRGRIFADTEEDKGQYQSEREVFWATGACLMIKADLYRKAGGLDADFFAHMEEIDLCWRLKKMGYKFMAQPKSVVYHVGGGTLAYENPKKTYLNFRNSLYMIHKNHDGSLLIMVFKRLIIDGLAAVKFASSFQFSHIYALLKAHIHYYKNLKSLGEKRKAIKTLTAGIKPNMEGKYKASIIYSRYFKGVKKFGDLNQRLFD